MSNSGSYFVALSTTIQIKQQTNGELKRESNDLKNIFNFYLNKRERYLCPKQNTIILQIKITIWKSLIILISEYLEIIV